MNHLLACRVCLAYDIRLHSITGCQLQDIYEKFTETLLETGDTKPTCVCYICFSLLKKFQKFIEKSKKSDQLLKQMINSGLELSVNSLELFCKQQTWTLGKTSTVRVISATEEEANVETPIKIEFVNSQMDRGDQNEDDLDGIPSELEITNQDSTTDSDDNMPLQNIIKQRKADGLKKKSKVSLKRSNVSKIKTSKILEPDAREIIISKEEQLQLMPERSKSLNYQNAPFKCDLCCKGFVDTKAFENHQEKHAEVLHLPKKRKSDNDTEKETLKSQAPLKKPDKGEENKAQNEDNRKIPDFKIRSNKFKTPIITIIPTNETNTSNINSDKKKSKIEANSNEQVTAPKNIFICDVCKKEYLWKSLLENHMKKWHIIKIDTKRNSLTDSNTNYQNCKNTNLLEGKNVRKNNNVTENEFSKNKNKHKDSICSDETQYKCSYCTKCFTYSSALAKHVRIHTGEKPYKCIYCMKCFTQSDDLATHVRTHTEEKLYKCSYCTKCLTTSSSLATHVRIHTGEKPFKCSYCTKCFTRSGNLASHVSIIHKKKKPYKCSYCTKCFTTSSILATHVRIHTGEKPYNCSYCTKCFTNSSALAKHVRIHTGEKPYKCIYCTKCFTRSDDLATHVRTHTEEKPYKCSYCTKCLTTSSSLAVHVRIHTGEKPYKCSYCTKCFSDSSHFANHLRIHTGEKPYKCSYCTKCFTQSSDLATHVRIHTGEKPYKCSYCMKCFSDSCVLATHKRIHTGEKPYKCSYCMKCFSHSSTLTTHVRIHTGEKPYKCSYCIKCFSHKSALAKHVRIHTGEKE